MNKPPILFVILLASLPLVQTLAAPKAPQKQPTPAVQVIPTRYDEDRFLVTPITATGQHLTFFTDTGGGLFIAQATVTRLGLTPRKTQLDGQDVQAVALPSFSPNASIPPVANTEGVLPVLPPDNGPSAFIYQFVDGLLGQSWFCGRVCTFDYPGHRLLLRSPGDLPLHAPQHIVPIGFQSNAAGVRQTNYPRIQVSVAKTTLDLLLDTGATTNLTPAALRDVGDGRPAIRATSFIVAGVFDRWHVQNPDWQVIEHAEAGSGQAMILVPRVTVAGYTVGPVWFTRRSDAAFHTFMSQFMDKQIDGSLGGDALRQFRVTLDYPNAAAVFEKPTSPTEHKGADIIQNPSLRAELMAMMTQDQDVRQRSIDKPKDPAISSEMAAVDAKNTARMKQIITQYGWPGWSLVGQDGENAAWVLVQHADADHAFQAQCLPLLKVAAEHGEGAKDELALLTDRVLLAQGKKQVYGTQFTWKTGAVEPCPLADPAHVDKRRKAMGLMPLAEYRQMLIKAYKLQAKK